MSDSNVYTAEKILSKRKHSGITQYLIKWKGYSLKESTWEPAENILDCGLLTAFENSRHHQGKSASSSSTSATLLNSSGTSSNSTSSPSKNNESQSNTKKRGRGRPRKSYSQQRQEQVQLQRHIEQQQQQKIQVKHIDKKRLVVFNPVGTHPMPVVEEIVYEPELTKDPIVVTDVTAQNSTVTISECKTPEGFFRT